MLKLYKHLKPYAAMVAGVFIFVFLQTMGDLYLPRLMSEIINKGVMRGDIAVILQLGVRMLLVAALGAFCAIVSSYLSARAAVGFGTVLRNKVFRQVQSFSLHEFDRLGTATLITRTTNDITQIQNVTVMIMRMMISAPMMAKSTTSAPSLAHPLKSGVLRARTLM